MSAHVRTGRWAKPWVARTGGHKGSEGPRGDWHPKIRAAWDRSGVYLIRDREGILLYVGESHSGRLGETLTRHFRQWTGNTAGATYNREHVEFAILPCPPASAPAYQDRIIRRLDPRDNVYGTREEKAERKRKRSSGRGGDSWPF